MSDKDLAVAATTRITAVSSAVNKPIYLIVFTDMIKTKGKFFVSIEKPEIQDSFVQVKGIFSQASEEEIINSFYDILTRAGKESIMEIYFPWHNVSYIRSLVFKAK